MDPRLRQGIDGLPFTSEGYERAKNILQTNYGQTSEIINAGGGGRERVVLTTCKAVTQRGGQWIITVFIPQ